MKNEEILKKVYEQKLFELQLKNYFLKGVVKKMEDKLEDVVLNKKMDREDEEVLKEIFYDTLDELIDSTYDEIYSLRDENKKLLSIKFKEYYDKGYCDSI